jgi:hypothetical protein
LIKSSIILFLACFLIYLPFSRQPDFFDSETAPAIIKMKGDSLVAEYSEYGIPHFMLLDKKEYGSKIGSRVEVIYELSAPEHVKINKVMYYWVVPIEIVWSFGIFIVLLGVAYATTHRPHPDALLEQLNYKEDNKTKYE